MRATYNRITRVRIKNYRSLADTTIELPFLTVLVGTNGSGKSNFLDSLQFIRDIVRLGLDRAANLRTMWHINDSADETAFDIDLEIDQVERHYHLVFDHHSLKVKHEIYLSGGIPVFERDETQIRRTPTGINPLLDDEEATLLFQLLSKHPDVAPTYKFLANMSFYNLLPDRRLTAPQPPRKPYPLAEQGQNFASALKAFLDNSTWANDFTYSLSLMLPHVQELQIEEFMGSLSVIARIENGRPISLDMESDGTVRSMAMLFALYQDPPRSLIALEEPELFLHPKILANLADNIKEASLRSQVIITTHSPDFISLFSANDLRIVERTAQGTTISPIDDIQLDVINERLFTTGDLLRVEGLRGTQNDE